MPKLLSSLAKQAGDHCRDFSVVSLALQRLEVMMLQLRSHYLKRIEL